MITKKQLKNEIFDIRKMLDETRMSIKQLHDDMAAEFVQRDKALKNMGGACIVNPEVGPMPECTFFDGMNKAVADFDKACTKAGIKCSEQKKRPKGDILREATERNIISIDGLRMRYGWNKPAIIEAINFYKWPIEKIEGSKLDYVDKSHIFILKEYFTPKRIG